METPVVIVPHDPTRGPLVAVRRLLIHSSIAELSRLGLYESYRGLIGSSSLARIDELMGPGWMPVELALEHYEACDKLGLSDEQVHGIGLRSGEKMGEVLLTANAHAGGEARDARPLIEAFSRMRERIYAGGSCQYTQLGPKKLIVEYKDNALFSIGYYRVAYLGFVFKAFGSMGIDIVDSKLSQFRSRGGQIEARFCWK
jgi:hypothetical protein